MSKLTNYFTLLSIHCLLLPLVAIGGAKTPMDKKTAEIIQVYLKKMKPQGNNTQANNPKNYAVHKIIVRMRYNGKSLVDNPNTDVQKWGFNSYQHISNIINNNKNAISRREVINALEKEFDIKSLRAKGLGVRIGYLSFRTKDKLGMDLNAKSLVTNPKNGNLKPKDLAVSTWDYKNKKYSLVFYICVAESKVDKWYRYIKRLIIFLVVGGLLTLTLAYLRKKYKEGKEPKWKKLVKTLKSKIIGKKGWFR